MPGASSTTRGVGEPGDLDLALADADGLDQHDVAAGGVEHPQRLRRRPRRARRGGRARPSSGCRRRGRWRGPASAPGRRAARRRRTATTGRPPARRPACPAARSSPTSALVEVDLPTPGEPGDADDLGVAGVRRERRHHLAQRGDSSSTSEISRATARASPRARARPGRDVGRPAGTPVELSRPAQAGTRTIRASPWPPPPHSAAAPTPPPRRLSSRARCSTIRAPDMPTGWPSAMAPPLTLTLSSSMPSSRAEAMPTAANASLISTRSRSAGVMPSLSQAFVDGVGRLALQRRVGAGDLAVRADLGEPRRARAPRPWPCSSPRPRRRRRRSARRSRR